ALEAVLLGDQLPAAERAAGVDEIEQCLAGGRIEARGGLPGKGAQELDRLRRLRDDELGQLVPGAVALIEVLGEVAAELSEFLRDLATGREARERRFARLAAHPVHALAAGNRAHVRGLYDLLEGRVWTTFAENVEDLGVKRAHPGAAIKHRREPGAGGRAQDRTDRPRGLDRRQPPPGRRHLKLPMSCRNSSNLPGIEGPSQRSRSGVHIFAWADDHASWYRRYWRTRAGISHASNGLSTTPYPGVMPTRRSPTPSPASSSPTQAF